LDLLFLIQEGDLLGDLLKNGLVLVELLLEEILLLLQVLVHDLQVVPE
jgi:hypothetical protein